MLVAEKEANLMINETAGIYCRLSQDDGNAGESGSIQTQKTLLTQYCNEHHITIGDYYCDDGWSGTNFDRPGFKRMLDDIETGKSTRSSSKTYPASVESMRRWECTSNTTLRRREFGSSPWRKTLILKTEWTIWCCLSPM